MNKKFKTNFEIKRANWKSNSFVFLGDKELCNITTDVIFQNDKYIEVNSNFLFEIICQNFFTKFKNEQFNLNFDSKMGLYLEEGYQSYFYDLMINKIFKNNENNEKNLSKKELFYKVRLEQFTSKYKAKIIFLLTYLKIDLNKEEQRFHKLLFKIKDNMIDFYLEDNNKENIEIMEEINKMLSKF